MKEVKTNKIKNINIPIFFIIVISLLLNSCFLAKPPVVDDYIITKDYQPFMEGTKAVELPEVSTLKLRTNIPKIDGATALYPLYAAFVQAVYPEYPHLNYYIYQSNIVRCSTTTYAFSSLISGDTDIIFTAKPSDEQLESAKEENVALYLTPIGKEAFVFFVNKHNPVSNLTVEQIKGIYSGKIINWKDIGGKKSDIKAYQRPKNSGSQTMLESIMGGNEYIMKPIKENVLTFMLDIVEQTSAYRNYNNAIGYSFLFYTMQMVNNKKIKLLSIDGVFPSIETIQTNEYPFTDYFYAITTTTENENVNKFIEWILSEQGQYLVKETGYVPLNNEKY